MVLLLHILVIACNKHVALEDFWWRVLFETLPLTSCWELFGVDDFGGILLACAKLDTAAHHWKGPPGKKKDRGQKDEMGQQHCQHHSDLNAWFTQIWDFRTKLASQHHWWHFIQHDHTFSCEQRNLSFLFCFSSIRKQPHWRYTVYSKKGILPTVPPVAASLFDLKQSVSKP